MMKKRLLVIALLLCAFIGFSYSTDTQASVAAQSVFDNAGIIEGDLDDFERTIDEYATKAGVDIIFVSTHDMNGKTDKVFLEDFYDEGYDNGTISEDAAIFLINMEDRILTLQGYGKCEFYLNNDRIEHMLDNITSYAKDGDYNEAVIEFAIETDYYMHEEKGVTTEYKDGQDYGETYDGPSNYYKKKVEIPHGVFAIISVIIGLIVVATMKRNAGGKVTTNASTYLDANSKGVTFHRDDYIRTSVRKVKHVESSSSGGRSSGGGGRSSGGHSHSGGSRGF